MSLKDKTWSPVDVARLRCAVIDHREVSTETGDASENQLTGASAGRPAHFLGETVTHFLGDGLMAAVDAGRLTTFPLPRF